MFDYGWNFDFGTESGWNIVDDATFIHSLFESLELVIGGSSLEIVFIEIWYSFDSLSDESNMSIWISFVLPTIIFEHSELINLTLEPLSEFRGVNRGI